jgi:hypothetical protein
MDPTPENFKAVGQLINDCVSGVTGILASVVAGMTAYQTFLRRDMSSERSVKNESEKSSSTAKVAIERASGTRGDDLFPGAFTYVLRNEIGDDWETGGFSNYPNDFGKATKWGVTQKTLAAFRGVPTTVDDVRTLTVDEAREIYRALFWERLQLDCVRRPQVAIALMDAGILFGSTIAVFNAQIACQKVGFGIKVDGIIGPKTVEALNAVRVQSWIPAFQECLYKRVSRIVARNTTQITWENGWKNRIRRLGTLT